MRFARRCIAVCVLAVTLMVPLPSHATYGGSNGKITFDIYQPDNSSDIYAMDPDGSDATLLVDGGRYSAWSPFGLRIAYTCTGDDAFYDNICTAAADGTGIDVLDTHPRYPGSQYRPFWSPDEEHLIVDNRFTFGHNPEEMYAEVWRIDATDGGDPIRMAEYGLSGSWSANGRIAYTEFRETFDGRDLWVSVVDATTPNSGVRLTESGLDSDPDWSPDGTKIVFRSGRSGAEGIYVMNADGSNEAQLRGGGLDPVWSPDGTKILFEDGAGDLWVMNADGTGEVNLTNTPTVYELDPSWQTIASGFARPKSAPHVRVPLVPAFFPCQAPTHVHGPPLEHPSCSPPTTHPAAFMTFGAAPSGSSPKATGGARFAVIPGAPGGANDADVRISVNLTDVRRASDLSDGTGGLELQVPVRLTDGVSLERTTMQDYTLKLVAPCAETADTTVGSTCSATTTANALIPSSEGAVVQEGQRAIWEFGQVKVWDGGDDGVIESPSDNTTLAVQGTFIP